MNHVSFFSARQLLSWSAGVTSQTGIFEILLLSVLSWTAQVGQICSNLANVKNDEKIF